MSAAIVLSLDFELRWGVAARLPRQPAAYRCNLEGVREVVPATLELFAAYDCGATWATVGALLCTGWDEFFERSPAPPRYANERLRFDPEWRHLDPAGVLHFAPDLVAEIAAAPGQEIGSHTFGHLLCAEAGVRVEDVHADATAMAAIANERGVPAPTSLVFPRNQIAFVDTFRDAGIARWRANPHAPFWRGTMAGEPALWIRAMRMADAITPLGTRRAQIGRMQASHFVRFNLPSLVWRLHVDRIVHDARGLRDGEALHLWWHPHNLGANVKRGVGRLRELLDRIRHAAPPGTRVQSMQSSNAAAGVA